MGIMKKIQMEEAEREREKQLAELKAEADALFPDEDWDAEDYEAYSLAMEKDD